MSENDNSADADNKVFDLMAEIYPEPAKYRLGKFTVSLHLIEKRLDLVKAMVEGCVVVSAKVCWHRNAIEYVALHDDFDLCTKVETTPYYSAAMACLEGRTFKREWRREAGSVWLPL